ncbi:hypothetical protein TIFTF001_025200 [Ficus carica]|uniref:Uncharacterized protein n=1 Tax=Ficus carica TaxID=3494 RepID=A0AA88AQW1_FICCA|nr:hypothetical protein TIFTF001_025200 [Ficus carica]
MTDGNGIGYRFTMLGPVSVITNGNRMENRFTMLGLASMITNGILNLLSCFVGTIDQERMTI